MNKIGIILLLYLLPLLSFAQLNKTHNSLRIDDTIIKQQVEYISPGTSGSSVIWDFSRLESINDEYSLSYNEPPIVGDSMYVMGYQSFAKEDYTHGELIVATEHNTMYYYIQRNDSLRLVGHENPAIKLEYTTPILEMAYPFNVGESIYSTYESQGLYSGTVPIRSQGNIQTTIDAYGKMILPTGDTLNPVIRTKTIQTLVDTSSMQISELQTHKWYTKGYRYPIFETIRSVNPTDSTEIFATAFYYPPQEHLYLDSDPDNLALLEELWDLESLLDRDIFVLKDSNSKDEPKKLNYRLYPNPVESILTIDYELESTTSVNILLSSQDGIILKNITRSNLSQGIHSEQIDCSSLMYGRAYMLKVIAGNIIINEKILRKQP